MSKTVLIVEKDLGLMKSIREGLKGRGFGVEETTDGKGAPELIRKKKPDLIVLAVDLDAGQNGYIICKKLKSDADLKSCPVVIIGDPKGFESHQKLKTRAEDYVGKPLEVGLLVERVGNMLGVPSAAVEDSFDPGAMLDENLAEEIPFENSGEMPAVTDLEPKVDPDFDMVDSMFEDRPAAPTDLAAPPQEIPLHSNANAFDDDFGEKTVVGFSPFSGGPAPALPKRPEVKSTTPSSLPPFQSSASNAGIDATEARELRSRVTELTGALEESRGQSSELEARIRDLEAQLETRQTELETARSAPSKGDSKEVFALRDAANKKDKDILRLKNELNAKEQEIVELREKENTLEQQASESSGEMAKRDAQLKTLQTKADQLTTERKKVDQQLLQAREDGRASSARLSTLQADYDALSARAAELEAQVEPTRLAQQEAESARAQSEAALSEARGEIEALKSQFDERSREADELRAQFDQAQMDLDATRSQLTNQATSFADEISGLRQKLAESEAETRKAEERASKHQVRVKAQQDHIERLRIGLQQTLQQLEDATAESNDLDIDELAEA